MKILFVHNNFPGQFGHLAEALARQPGNQIVAIGSRTSRPVKGVKLLKYSMPDGNVAATHPFARRFDLECRRAEQVLYSLSSLASSGFIPDAILAHPGWGETLPLRTIFPKARIIVYCEFFYGLAGRDVEFDPEFPHTGIDGHVALHLKNAATLFAISDCDRGLSPTAWQRSTYPPEFQEKITVIHEGVDVDIAKPTPDAVVRLPSGRKLTAQDEVVTYVARNLEPIRGYHVFMRALPRILAERPHAQIVIVGGDGTSYGAQPARGTTWKARFFDEVADRIDRRRVHFTGRLAYEDYLRVLQISSAHVYLTYPFVLSWSLMEAMSVGCMVIASDTAPVKEVIDGRNGLLVPFFDTDRLAERTIEVLADPRRFNSFRAQARRFVLENHDRNRLSLPALISFLQAGPASHQAEKPRRIGKARPATTRAGKTTRVARRRRP